VIPNPALSHPMEALERIELVLGKDFYRKIERSTYTVHLLLLTAHSEVKVAPTLLALLEDRTARQEERCSLFGLGMSDTSVHKHVRSVLACMGVGRCMRLSCADRIGGLFDSLSVATSSTTSGSSTS
jgi:hypothetical protein